MSKPLNTDEAIDEILKQHREWIRGIRTDHLIGASDNQTKEAILQLIKDREVEAIKEHLDWWKGDIESNFMPKCSFCGTKRKVVGQLPKGIDAQEHNSLPRNWMYYCQKCYDEGTERENEAMYG